MCFVLTDVKAFNMKLINNIIYILTVKQSSVLK